MYVSVICLFAISMFVFGVFQCTAYRCADSAPMGEESREELFMIRQFRRRRQIGFLIALSGFFIFFGILIPVQKDFLYLHIFVWFLAFGSLFWTMLIALIDIVSIRLFFRKEYEENKDFLSDGKK